MNVVAGKGLTRVLGERQRELASHFCAPARTHTYTLSLSHGLFIDLSIYLSVYLS